MKKWIVIICLLITGITFALYFLLTKTKSLNYNASVSSTKSAVSRLVINKSNWQFWWPGGKIDDSTYSFQNCTYRIEKVLLNGFKASIFNNKNDTLKGFLEIADYKNDSTQFQWTSGFTFSANPFKRLKEHAELKKITNNLEELLKNMGNFFDGQENIYGLKIVEQKVSDSSLISTKNTFSHYPSTEEIYSMIHSLEIYIQQKEGKQVNFPMLNVHKDGPERYEAMVALPTKSDLPTTGNFNLKKMVLGKILMAEIKGGVYTVMKGEEELTNYVNDYKKLSPAIPFQSLVTNRLLETDTSKWVTRLYYPIFY